MDKVDSLVIEHLRHIRSKVDQIADDVNDLKSRMSNFESSVISTRRDILNAEAVDAHLQVSFDKLAKRIAKIETRLEIV